MPEFARVKGGVVVAIEELTDAQFARLQASNPDKAANRVPVRKVTPDYDPETETLGAETRELVDGECVITRTVQSLPSTKVAAIRAHADAEYIAAVIEVGSRREGIERAIKDGVLKADHPLPAYPKKGGSR